MAKAVPLKQALIFWIATVGSAILLYYGTQLSEFLIRDLHASAWIRWMGVLAGVSSIIPWIVIIAMTFTVLDAAMLTWLAGTSIGLVYCRLRL